ncbi:hypothetical protein BGZ76_004223 [Entomortierella beljakovae]|nr:hypothetical protein BGZ76_004223 [Entomortierella beljakovae]
MVSTLDVIVANEPGKIISVPYKKDEPIYQLVIRASEVNGDSHEKDFVREISINGMRVYHFRQPIERYRVFGNVVTYKLRTSKSILLTVITPSKKTLVIKCITRTPINRIKQMIQDEEGTSPYLMTLVYNGVTLNDGRKLEDYNINSDCTLYLTLGHSSGDITIYGVEHTDIFMTIARELELNSTVLKGRAVGRGTNVECKCECTNYNVICKRQFGRIELSEAKFKCPNCFQNYRIVPISVGFTDCKYRFHGIKTTGEQYTSEWKDVPVEDAYQLFNPRQQQTKWKRLVIESAEINACDDCTICLEPMHIVLRLGCGHRFHRHCYSQWNSKCPNCYLNQHLVTGEESK